MRMLPIAAAVALAAATAIGGLASSAAPAAADILASNPIQYVTKAFFSSSADRRKSLTVPSHNFIMTPASPARTLTAVKLLRP
jgi:hypothetical protein